MAKKKPVTLYEILIEKSRSLSGPAVGRPRPSRKKSGARKGARASDGGGGIGEKRIQVSLSPNGILGLAVVLVFLLAGMYALGRYQASGPGKGKAPSLASMEMEPGLSPKAAPKPAPGTAKASRKKAGKTLKGLCVISYAYTTKGKALALQMVRWLRAQGLEKTLYASDRGKSWMVVVPFGEASPKALTRRIFALKAPPFAERKFRFADQKMFRVTLRVDG